MKLPANLDKTLSENDYGLFPPLGYLSMEETSDGGGDYYGLYWEIGKEASYPIVCASRHEEALLVPEFKDYESFHEWFEETQGQGAPGMSLHDTDFFLSLMTKGKILTKKGEHIDAMQKLERAVSLFSEDSTTWYWLSENYYATGQKEKGDRAIVNSIASNFFFGFPDKKSVDKFNAMIPSDDLQKHPIVKRGTGWIRGGDFSTPLSVNYDCMMEIVEDCRKEGDYKTAMLMKQNFGLLMSYEPEAVREKYKFEGNVWMESFKDELFAIYPARKY